MKAKLALLIMLLTVSLLTGCYDMKEIDETAYVVALGIDKGEASNFVYTFQFSSPLAISTSDGETEKSKNSDSEKNSTVTNLTITAPDFYVARNMTNNFMSKNVDMSHLKIIIFSHKIAVEDLEDHSRLLLREREVRPHTAIAVSATTAKEFLEKVNPELESNTSKYYELMSLQSNNVYAPTKRLHDFVDEISSGTSDAILPIATCGNDIGSFSPDTSTKGWIGTSRANIDSQNSLLWGMAIFKNGKLSGTMDGDSSMIFNILNQNIENCTITVASKAHTEQTLSFRLTIPEKAGYKINPKKNLITISQGLHLEFLGSILPEGYTSFDELYSYVQNMITDRTLAFLYDISAVKNADILSLRNHFKGSFLTWDSWESYPWQEFYSNADFEVKIKFT